MAVAPMKVFVLAERHRPTRNRRSMQVWIRVSNWGAGVSLDATVTDDGLPGGPLDYSWTQTGGPDTATITSPDSEDTAVSFPQIGNYTFTLSVDDGLLIGADSVTVMVGAPGGTGPYQQDGSGFVVLEAENFDTHVPQGNHVWESHTAITGFYRGCNGGDAGP
eukprot:UN05405